MVHTLPSSSPRPSSLYPPSLRAPGALIQNAPVSYVGTTMGILGLVLKNMLLTLITLGIYTPWARTELRRYMWAHIQVAGSPLMYTGTGIELFRGYLIAGGLLLLLTLGYALAQTVGLPVVGSILLYLVIFLVIPFAMYGSRRYLLSRTRWRGVAFGLEGSALDFAWVFWKGALFTVLTLGIGTSVARNWMRAHITNNSQFGTERFEYDGKDLDVLFITVKGIFLTVLTLGIYSFWYQAELNRYILSHTRIQRAQLRSDITGGHLLVIALLGLVLLPLSLGLAYPWFVTYQLREILGRISLEGELDLEVIQRGLLTAGGAAADGAADLLEADFGL